MPIYIAKKSGKTSLSELSSPTTLWLRDHNDSLVPDQEIMSSADCVDPFRKTGVAWYHAFSRNELFEDEMGRSILHYQRLNIDADSQPVIVKMEKELGNNLLQIAKLELEMTLIALKQPYDCELQYSDQGNRIHGDMKVAAFSLGHCMVHAEDIHQDNKIIVSPKRSGIANTVARLYAAAYIDTSGHKKIMLLYDFNNKQSLLLKKVRDEIAKYSDTIGYLPMYMEAGLL